MCGIVGYVGPRSAQDTVIDGLRRLEYRGYDSAGVAVVAAGSLALEKRAGKLANLEKVLDDAPLPTAGVGIGHTRWATHGQPNDVNAHPHTGGSRRVALVHNGIIENFVELRARVEADDHVLLSETDTEIVAHLVELQVQSGVDLTTAMQRVCQQLDGAFTLVAIDADDPDTIVAARCNSPLVVGIGEGENFLGSDVAAFIEFTREALELGQDQIVVMTRDDVRVTDFWGRPVQARRFHVDWDLSAAEKDGHDWFMRKEIFEQPRAVADSLIGRRTARGQLQLDEMRLDDEELRDIDKIIIIACGTSFYAGMVAKYAIEHWTRTPVEVELASEFRYRDPVIDAHAGPEIGVASTKGFLTQLVACYLLALYIAQVKGTRFGDEIDEIMRQLESMPDRIEEVLAGADAVYDLAREHAGTRSVLFLGRHAGYPVALEGALKLKELAYLHAEGFAAGELKHGPIALVDDGMPALCVVPPKGRDQLHGKMLSGIQEVRARGARTICLAEVGDASIEPYADVLIRLPKVPVLLQPLVAIVPLQLFACELATTLGHDVDQPRNLAKSVTVE